MANDFSGDGNCLAVYRQESGALTTDSKGSNTLTNSGGVTANAATYREGSYSGDYTYTAPDYLSLANASLPATWPGKASHDFSVTAHFRCDSLNYRCIAGVYHTADDDRSWVIEIWNDSGTYKIRVVIGKSSGADWDIYSHATGLSVNTWYFVALIVDMDGNIKIRLSEWNGSSYDHEGTDIDTSLLNAMSATSADFRIGSRSDSVNPWSGQIDEVCVFDDLLTDQEADDIRDGSYSPSPGNLTAAVSDSVTIGESVSAEVTPLEAVVADALSIGEGVASKETPLEAVVADSLDIAESVEANANLAVTISDGVTIGESVSAQVTPLLAVAAESVDIAEALEANANLAVTISDGVAIGESVSVAVTPLLVSVADSLGIAEAVAASKNPVATVSDSMGIGESVAAEVTPLLAVVADALSIGDVAVAQETLLLVSVADSLGIAEATAIEIPVLEVMTSDVLVLVDQVLATRIGGLSATQAEALHVIDQCMAEITPLLAVTSDSLQISDAALANSSMAILAFLMLKKHR